MRRVPAHSRRYQSLTVAPLILLAGSALALAIDGWTATRLGQPGKDLNAIFFVDAKRGWIAGDGGYVSHTDDGGHSWARQPVATSDGINDIYFRNKDDGYLLAGSRIFNTRNGGVTWIELRRFLPLDFAGASPELYSVRFSGKKKGWVVGSATRKEKVVDSLLFYTNDEGVTWRRQTVPTRRELIHLAFVNDQRGWIVGAGGVILHTDDGGESWKLQQSETNAAIYHVDFRNSRNGWAVGERGTVLRTANGGETWFPVDTGLRTTLLSIQFVDDNEGWTVGKGGVILRSTDSGRSWSRQESRTPQNLYALFMGKKSGWAVGGDGVVLQYER
jgi:photosystem II stability/assembly factor-like uncharacterized protein